MDAKLQEARGIAIDGVRALSAHQGAAAEAAFLKAISMGWPGADIWIQLSHARSLLRNIDGAEEALKKALGLEPENPRALLYMGAFLQACGQVHRAQGFYEKGIAAAEAFAEKTAEITDLVKSARHFLSNMPASARHPVDDFMDVHGVGSEPEDELLIQSLQILAERKQPYVSQPSRFLYAGLPQRQFFRRDEFAWSGELEAQTPAIREELDTLLSQPDHAAPFAPYVESNRQGGAPSDTPLMGSTDWSAFYLVKQGKRIEANIARLPKTMAAIDAIGADAMPPPQPSVLISLLKPGARIPPHVGMFNTRLICHLPLIIPAKCGFRVGNDTREWTPGELFLFDDSINHEAWNESSDPRYILIFEVWRPELSQRQRRLLTDLFAPGF
jgi:tetratricopeptide (TPR) repeat protein